MTEAEVASIIEEVDENGDGKLDYKEVHSHAYVHVYSYLFKNCNI